MKKLMIMGLLAALVGCGGAGVREGAKEAGNANFYQHWVHSHEEQGGSKTPNIFRPAGSRDFPASRFRMELGFDANGQCNYKFLSPNDRHEMRNCIYTKIGNKVYLYDEQGKMLSHLSFTVESASKDKMTMHYGVASPVKKDEKKDGKSK